MALTRTRASRAIVAATRSAPAGPEPCYFSHQLLAARFIQVAAAVFSRARCVLVATRQRHLDRNLPGEPRRVDLHRSRLFHPEWRVRNSLPSRTNSWLLALPVDHSPPSANPTTFHSAAFSRRATPLPTSATTLAAVVMYHGRDPCCCDTPRARYRPNSQSGFSPSRFDPRLPRPAVACVLVSRQANCCLQLTKPRFARLCS